MSEADGSARDGSLVAEARAILGSTGQFERRRAPLDRDDRRVAVAAFLLVVAPTAAVLAPELLDDDIARAAGGGFGLVGLARVLGAAVGIAVVVRAQRRGRDRLVVASVAAALSTLTLLLCAVSTRPPALAPMMGGATMAVATACLTSLVVDTTSVTARVRGVAAFTAGVLAGVALVPVATAVAYGLGGNVRAAFLSIGVAAAAAALPAVRHGVDRPARDDAEVRDLVRARLGHAPGEGVDDDDRSTDRGELRRVATTASVRAGTLAAMAAGSVFGPLPRLVDVLLRDRWLVPRDSRLLAFGILVAAGASLIGPFARRAAPAWRTGPARLAHQVGWCAGAGGVALALAASAPWLVVAGLLLATAVGLAFCVLAGCIVVVGSVVDARFRPHAGGMLVVAMLAGSVAGDVLVSSIGSRFGPAWAVVALAALFVGAGGRIGRSLTAFEADAVATATRIVEGEELRIRRAQGQHLALLSCHHVDFSYGQVQVLFDVSFSIDDGEMVALLGTNGAGKSTLLRVISGLGAPSRGSVHFDGRDITFAATDSRVALGITQIPGGKAVFGALTVAENLRAYGYSRGRRRAAVDKGIDDTFVAFPRLAERRNQLASTLSGGEQQMLGLGKALILQPRLLLIDELSLGLAPIVVGELLSMVQRINAGGTAIVLVEQSVNVALSLVDRAYFMEKGEVRFDGAAAALVQRPDLLRSVFLSGAQQALVAHALDVAAP